MIAEQLSNAELKALLKELAHNRARVRGENFRATMYHVNKGAENKRPSKRSRGASQRAALREQL